MKLIRISLAAVLALAVGATVPAFAQHDHDKDKDAKHDRDDHKARGHEDNGRHEGQVRHEEHERHEAQERHEEHERHEAQERHEMHERHEAEERHEAREHEREHERHVAYVEHRRIAEANWHEHFGHEHRFIYRPVIVEGRARFHYGGYWFVMARPLPPGWRSTDEVYVDYIDGGYVMCSPVHPGIHISINIL